MQIPFVGDGNRVTGIYSLSLSASGRYDDYSDFGDTFNPKFGLTYEPLEWVKLRGTWGKSFQAPSLSDGSGAAPPTIFAFPLVIFANPAQAPVPGQAQIFLGGGGTELKPQKSTNWSAGFEFTPPASRVCRSASTTTTSSSKTSSTFLRCSTRRCSTRCSRAATS